MNTNDYGLDEPHNASHSIQAYGTTFKESGQVKIHEKDNYKINIFFFKKRN